MSICKLVKLDFQQFGPAFFLLIIIACSITINVNAKDKSYPGELINIGTHHLHINCTGQGSPTVVIDSGLGGFSLEWHQIQNNLSKHVRICSYDRAGYGWSELGPRPRTTARITRELHTLLSEAKVPGPYLLVGHSFGGYNIRYFASEYPDLVAGMVLIDASHPEQFNTEEFKVNKRYVKKHKNSVRIRLIHPNISDNYPTDTRRIAFILMSRLKSRSTLLNESDYMETSANQIALRSQHQPYTFPVVIITRGKRVWPHNDLGDRRERQWMKLQEDLGNIATDPDHFIAYKSGHVVHLDQPDLVSENILYAVNNARRQIVENELIKKFDIRHSSEQFVIPAASNNDSAYQLKTINFDKFSFINNVIHQTMFKSSLPHLINKKLIP